MQSMLEIKKLNVEIDGTKILSNFSVSINPGEVHAIMGPNGSGKSTLANVIAGNPVYTVTSGNILFQGEDILDFSPDERAQKGIFLAFQYPVEIPGVSMTSFLRSAHQHIKETTPALPEFNNDIEKSMSLLNLPMQFKDRGVNEGFSGGEKKKAEMLQLSVLDPTFVMLDETDSGLDIDSLQIVAKNIKEWMKKEKGVLAITHYSRILKYIEPDFVHIMKDGAIVKTGGKELAHRLEEVGYSGVV